MDSGVRPDAAVDGGHPGSRDAGCSVEAYETPPGSTGAAVCAADSSWGPSALIPSVSTADDDVFGSISGTEQTLVWMSVVGGVPTLRYADRDSPGGPFNPAGGTPIFDTYYAAERPAVSPDGNRIVVVRADGLALGEYTRTAFRGAFSSTASEASFEGFNSSGLYFLADERFGDPQLSNDDLTLYYSRYVGTRGGSIHSATRAPGAGWQPGSPVQGASLVGGCGRRMRPTGISSDQLTLFYWDEVTGTQRATFRPATDAPFAGVVDLGARPHAQPNVACTRLYYSTTGVAPVGDSSSGLEDIVFASR